MKALYLLAALAASLPAVADETGLKLSGSGEFWTYGTVQDRAGDSPLNPGNRVANLAAKQWTGEARFNLRASGERAELVLRPRLLQQHSEGMAGSPDAGEAYLSQAFVRVRLNDILTATAGRELLTWGPANFRSPSHPIYFDAGRTNPLREVSGVDLLRLTLTSGPLSGTVARIGGDGHLSGTAATPTTLAKVDWRGGDGMLSAIVANPAYGSPFLGAFAQFTPDEAWLVYGEIGSGRRARELIPAASPFGPPFAAKNPSPRRTTALLGATYTLENGQSVGAEWLHDGHGFKRNQGDRYFARASESAQALRTDPANLAALQNLRRGLGQAPVLLGRDYLSALWQSNPQQGDRYWRLMWTANLADHSQQASAYIENSLTPRVSLFALATRNFGGRNSEFGMLLAGSLTLGVKLFAF